MMIKHDKVAIHSEYIAAEAVTAVAVSAMMLKHDNVAIHSEYISAEAGNDKARGTSTNHYRYYRYLTHAA